MGNVTPGPRILPTGALFPAGGSGNAYHTIFVNVASLTFAESYDGAAQASYLTLDRDAQQLTSTYTAAFSGTAESTSTLTGALQSRGGLGVVKDVTIGGSLMVASGLYLTGAVEFNASTSGLVLLSPDGTRYRVTVANGGALTTAALAATYLRYGGVFHIYRPGGVFTYLRP